MKELNKISARCRLLLFFLSVTIHLSANTDIDFVRYDDFSKTGNYVRDIFMDRKGFMWFGTEKGAFRFDGYKFITYRYDPLDKNSISSSYIYAIDEDKEGNIFFATKNGISIYSYINDNFRNLNTSSEDPPFDQIIRDVHIDRNDTVWVGTHRGLEQLDIKLGTSTSFFPEPDSNLHQFGNVITKIAEDSRGNLWLGTWGGGLLYFDRQSRQFARYLVEGSKHPLHDANIINTIVFTKEEDILLGTQNSIRFFDTQKLNYINREFIMGFSEINSEEPVYSIHFEKNQRIWIGTNNNILKYNPIKKEFSKYVNDPLNENSLSFGANYALYKDKLETFWIGNTSICKYSPYKDKFKSFYYKPNSSKVQDFCSSFLMDENNTLWVGTFGDGLKLYNGSLKFMDRVTNENSQLSSNKVNTLLDDGNGSIWVGTVMGINIFDSQTKKLEKYFEYNHKLLHQNIYLLYKDKTGQVWICTQEGVNLWNDKTRELTELKFERRGYNFKINIIKEDSKGNIWLGSVNGLLRFNYQDGELSIVRDSLNDLGLSAISVNDIAEDYTGNLWIATDAGLYFYDQAENHLSGVYLEAVDEGLSITGMLQSAKGDLWLIAAPNLIRYQVSTGKTYFFDKKKGAGFNSRGYFSHPETQMFFIGGEHRGFFAFHPENINYNPNIPPVYITGFYIFNEQVSVGEGTLLKKQISITDSIILSYKESVFSFEFAALDYVIPQNNKYAYKMEGFDQKWQYTDAQKRTANYTNLNPGSYVFRVKASNSDGIWNESGTSIHLIITPPWWRTWQAGTFFVIFMILVYWFLKLLIGRRERIVSELKKNHELSLMRLRFFTNISHEFRTPLTLITGPVSRILKNTGIDEKIRQQLNMVYTNSLRMLNLVNQVLDIRKLDTGNVSIQYQEVELVKEIKILVESFIQEAENKNINLVFNADPGDFKVVTDKNLVEIIASNLISNAIKYTPYNKEVAVEVALQENIEWDKNRSTTVFSIVVSDTGLGIADSDKKQIFSRFFRSHVYEGVAGSGIGLSLVKELTQLLGGRIYVDDNKPIGTVFTVHIPLEEYKKHDEQSVTFIASKAKNENIKVKNESWELQKVDVDKQVILVVEDNQQMLEYISDIITDAGYQILYAENGKEGLNKAIQYIPDLIISDVMMPLMDGIELCQQLKTNSKTSHIPIVLLTAKTLIEHQFEGFQKGADAYISKPFDEDFLLIRISNIFKSRALVQEKFRKQFLSGQIGLDKEDQPKENKGNKNEVVEDAMQISDGDSGYVLEIKKIIELHYQDENFNTEELAKKLLVTRQYLHRKFAGITGINPSAYIKEYRLKKAKELFANDPRLTVNEVAYKVGFKYPSSFSRAYKDFFGHYPTD